MKYAVFVYSIPIDDTGSPYPDVGVAGGEGAIERAIGALEELIANEGVQREPVMMDDFGVQLLQAGLKTWSLRDTNGTHKEAQR